jgi:chromatin remodeling complex protein RSC6
MAKKAASRKTATGRKTARKGGAKTTRRATSARGRTTKSAKKTSGAGRTSGGGGRGTANAAFMRPVNPSPALAEVVGDKPIPRSEVTKRLWAYIKKNRLQDQKNKRMINADSALKPVFGGKSAVNMFEMTKLVGKHLK